MEFGEGIVVVCPFCGLVFASSWEDADDYFECPSCRSVLAIGKGAEKLKLEEKLKAHAARCRKKILEEPRKRKRLGHRKKSKKGLRRG